MHSSLNRAQAVFGFFTTVAMFVAGFAALSVLLYPGGDARADVELRNVQVIKGRPHYYSAKREEYAQIKFDLDADLSPLFNWNTKQLFLYVLASYSSTDNNTNTNTNTNAASIPPASKSIIWDKIIPAPESPYSYTILRERVLALKDQIQNRNQNQNQNQKPSPKSAQSKRTKQQQQQQQAKRQANKTPELDSVSSSKSKSKSKSEAHPAVLHLRNQRSKYQISDITGRMAERGNVTLSVGWNVQPWVGALWWGPGTGAVPHTAGLVGESGRFDFPALKGSQNKDASGTGNGNGNGDQRKGGNKASV